MLVVSPCSLVDSDTESSQRKQSKLQISHFRELPLITVQLALSTISQTPSSSGKMSKQRVASKVEFEGDHDFLCGPCKMENKMFEAVGYCSFCRHYLCKGCYEYHKKLGKIHSLQHKEHMPTLRPHSRSSFDPCLETCQQHKHKVVEIYCKTHDEVCCIICVTAKHRGCDYAYIPEFTENLPQSQQSSDSSPLLNMIQALIGQFETLKSDNGNRLKDLDRQRREFGGAVRRLKKEIETIVEQLEKQVVGEMRQVFDRENKQLAANIDKCDDALKVLHDTYANTVEAMESTGTNRAFAVTKKSNKVLQESNTILKSLAKDTFNTEIKFEENAEILRAFRKMKSFGRLKVKKEPVRSKSERDLDTTHTEGQGAREKPKLSAGKQHGFSDNQKTVN